MPENTPNLGIPKPLGNEYFNRTNFNQILEVIDQNAAKKTILDNHITEGNAHGIGDKSTLLTTNKSSIVGALNELFTNANDGKIAVANAVTAKGVTASPSDTFSTLATKIGQINTGKKIATGSITSASASVECFAPYSQYESNLTTAPYILLNGALTFQPSYFIVWNVTSSGWWWWSIYDVKYQVYKNPNNNIVRIGSSVSGASYSWFVGNNQLNLKCTQESVLMPVGDTSTVYNWLAIE